MKNGFEKSIYGDMVQLYGDIQSMQVRMVLYTVAFFRAQIKLFKRNIFVQSARIFQNVIYPQDRTHK